MSWPFLYFTGDRLSGAELTSARLDGDLIEVGDAYMPTDTVETPALRAASLRPRVPDALAVTRESAAWIHGAVPEAPTRHTVQRRRLLRVHQVIDARLHYRDQLLAKDSTIRIGGVWVTTLAHTLADLVRGSLAGEDTTAYIEAILQHAPGIAARAATVLRHGPGLHYKRPALEYLRRCTAQEEVTRYTS